MRSLAETIIVRRDKSANAGRLDTARLEICEGGGIRTVNYSSRIRRVGRPAIVIMKITAWSEEW
jgi:hypothetical protein